MKAISFRDVHGIAEELGVDVQTVRRWIQSGKLRAFKPGKEYRIRDADLEEFLAAREVRPKAPGRSSLEPTFNDALGEERRLGYLRGWRAFAFMLVDRWEKDPPETSAEIAPLSDAMTALVEQGVFSSAGATSQSEQFELQLITKYFEQLSEIADGVEKSEQRQNTLRVMQESRSA